MSGFLRKASLSRKKGLNDEASPRVPSARADRPPRSRSVSEASSMNDNGDNGKVKKKHSTRKRLSSLFSSSTSLSSMASDRDRESSPNTSARPSSNLNVSTSTSGASTPTSSVSTGVPRKQLNGKGVPPSDLKDGMNNLRLGTDEIPLSNSPESGNSPTTSLKTTAGPPIQPVSAAGSSPSSSLKEQPPTEKRIRRSSLYSQWDLEKVGLESDSESEDEDAFLTPSEGLSEVEEGDEEEEELKKDTAQPPPYNASPSTSAAAAAVATGSGIQNGSATQGQSLADAKTVEKGTVVSQEKDVAGTGPSTIKRSTPTVQETKVSRKGQIHATKAGALAVDQEKALATDIDVTREALSLFLTSRMREAEVYLEKKEDQGQHLYIQSAQGIIEALKGMMTFDSIDLTNALEICKGTSVTASALRKPTDSLVSRFVKAGAGVARVKSMTVLERHAELVYAETSLTKALLAIVSGGDWLGLIREALNMRAAHGIYHILQQYLEDADKNGYDDSIDTDFRSGVVLGAGTSSLMLSLLPAKVMKIASLLGYGGDKDQALLTLYSAGGWHRGEEKPDFDENNEGLRRPVCDLILLTFHLVISTLMPVTGIDVPMAKNILAYNLRRYPDGIFFLYFQARSYTAQCQPENANRSLQKALDSNLEYIQLQHMCLWDYACNFMMLCNWKGALDCFSILKEESNWSRATYTYAAAASLVQLAQEEGGDATVKLKEAEKFMQQIPKLTKKIAGKSLPIEKLVSRKARKFHSQGQKLFLPAMELAYVFGSLSNTPRRSLLGQWLPRIDKALQGLDSVEPENYGNGHEYWDDYCLGHFLRGMCQFISRYQPKDAAPEATEKSPSDPSDDELDKGAEKDLQAVIRHGPDVEFDHYILFHCYYELGRLYARRGDHEQAKFHLEVVMAGKLPDHNPYMAKASGKYSLEGALLLKTHAALVGVKENEKK
ncbi:uncharacterized protein I303_103789 [Kwoniella dejecticola CBS 10117]|uniref:Cytoplasmic protein n=1 Tax=Kwoniella dejecticola CBS 10117 TaxID=1296121 RepID=A0A1A6A7Q5_9TREE|nr:uncharacterized protein I303_03807 [Kwoniella dejecticola CBS 10117]OBR86089.1 hypothetical protein I303_03807 [Kwoniella dejecticola CBS 10117]